MQYTAEGVAEGEGGGTEFLLFLYILAASADFVFIF